MNAWRTVAVALTAGVALCAVWGAWRWAFHFFRIRADQMTVRKLGLKVLDPGTVSRVDSILASFAGGFNAMIARPTWRAWQSDCDARPALTRPFAEEGAAMGYTLRRLFRYSPSAFERDIVRPRPEFRYLHYVGLGFWSGMRNHDPKRVQRVAKDLDPLHQFLCYDGYGFKHAFFDYPKSRGALRRLESLDGYARQAAYQGVGRAFFFLFMEEPDTFVAHTRALGEYAADVASGAGLAAVFVNPDRLDYARAWAAKMPVEWRPHVHLGMCFGLKARAINDLDEFQKNVQALPRSVQDAVWASIRECDRIELLVRGEESTDGYREWRERVTQWLDENVDYPLAGLRIGRTGNVASPLAGDAGQPSRHPGAR